MTALENRIPPPIILVLTLVIMKGLAMLPGPTWQAAYLNGCGAIIIFLGFAVAAAGVIRFRNAKTTVNPLDPSRASSLVTGGVFSLSRNPMYLGMLLVTIGWGVILGSLLSLIAVLGFALFINRFQIAPEERAMRALFGGEFSNYCAKTRRWI